MPIIKRELILPEGELAVWRVDESLSFLADDFDFDSHEVIRYAKMSDKRKREWLSSRVLIHELSKRTKRTPCIKDEYGKPFLPDSRYQISISHSLNRTAVFAAPYNIGVDVQEIVSKMHRISHKFVSEKERAFVGEKLEELHIIWGAKEAMYKAWGKRGIDFREHMHVESFQWDGNHVFFNGLLRKGNISMHFDVNAEKIDQFILVYAQEKYRVVT